MRTIKRRDGRQVEVDDSYILANGESYLIPLHLMDSGPRMVTDSFGRPAGGKPGFMYAADDVALAVTETLHREYCDALSNRWQSNRWSKPSGNLEAASKLNQPSGSLEAASKPSQSGVDAAYEEYRRGVEARWK